MRSKIKTISLFLLTLIIGIGIGFEISEIIANKQHESMQEYFQPKGFVKFYEGIIEPDGNQKQLIEPILLKYHEKITTLAIGGFKEIEVLKDSLRIELKAHLTKEQLKRFDDKMNEFKEK